MTKHWVRDLPVTDVGWYIANGNHMMGNAVLYNFLRAAGWGRLWECDGEKGDIADSNHVTDGNVQSDLLTSWAVYNGASISKDTTQVYSGVRSLKCIAGGSGDGVETVALVSMSNPFTLTTAGSDALTGPVGREMTFKDISGGGSGAYNGWYIVGALHGNANDGEFRLNTSYNDVSAGSGNPNDGIYRFVNPSGIPRAYLVGDSPHPTYTIRPRYEIMAWVATDVALDVWVDQGDAVFVNVGTIPANGGVFTRYGDADDPVTMFFKRLGSGNTTIRFVAQGSGTFYIGGLLVYTSTWEKPDVIKKGTDGILTNPDQFSTAGSFTPDDSDIGKVLFVYDPTNNKNSGAYPIIANLGGGVVQLNLRSGSAALTTQGGLSWRIEHVDWKNYPNYGISTKEAYSGFGFQSPHISDWRFFLKQSLVNGQTGKGSIMWSAPEDTDFNISSGTFYKTGPSTQRNRQVEWYKIPDSAAATGEHLWRGGYSYKTSPHDSRIFFMLDEDGAFFNFFMWDEDGDHGCHLHGYLGSDLPDIESFYEFSRWESRGVVSECYFDNSAGRFGYSGTTFDSNGMAIPACLAQLGIGTATTPGISVESQSNAGVNPWSGREWVRPLILWRDSDNMNNPEEAAVQNSDIGIYQMRNNKTQLTTFESDQFLHLVYGYVWEWSGETLVP